MSSSDDQVAHLLNEEEENKIKLIQKAALEAEEARILILLEKKTFKEGITDQERAELERLLDAQKQREKGTLQQGIDEANYQVAHILESDFEKMVQDYNKKEPLYPGAPANPDDRLLKFSSKTDALSFFKEQAEKNREFHMECKEFDHGVYSDGKGMFAQGKIEEVRAFRRNPENYVVNKEDGSFTKKPELTAEADVTLGAPSSTSAPESAAKLITEPTSTGDSPPQSDSKLDETDKDTPTLS